MKTRRKFQKNCRYQHRPRYELPKGKENFLMGILSDSFRIEGARNESGTGFATGDTWANSYPELIVDGSTPNISAQSYYLYKKDIDCVKSLNVDYYCLGINWARIMPDGTPYTLNMDGIQFYSDLIDCQKYRTRYAHCHVILWNSTANSRHRWLDESTNRTLLRNACGSIILLLCTSHIRIHTVLRCHFIVSFFLRQWISVADNQTGGSAKSICMRWKCLESTSCCLSIVSILLCWV